MDFGWKNGTRFPGSAQGIGEHLEQLADDRGGLTALIVVEDARPKASPLHGCFEWNNRAAAEKYRLEQARHLLGAVTVMIETSDGSDTRPVRAFVVVHENGDGATYQSIVKVLMEPALRSEVLDRALRELEQWRRRYQDLAELADVLKAIEDCRKVA